MSAWRTGATTVVTYTAIRPRSAAEAVGGADAPPIEVTSEWWLVAGIAAAAVMTGVAEGRSPTTWTRPVHNCHPNRAGP